MTFLKKLLQAKKMNPFLRWKQEKVENGEMDISDNNNTNEKNKNGCVSPDLEQHTLYSQG